MWNLVGIVCLLAAIAVITGGFYSGIKRNILWKKWLLGATVVFICIAGTACGSTAQKTTNDAPASTTQQQQEQTQPEQTSQPQVQPVQSQAQPVQQPQPQTNANQVQVQSKQQPEAKAAAATPSPQTTAPATVNTPAPQVQKQEVTVYVTRTGEKYHSAGCQYLRKSQIPMSLADAKASGYTPCSKCGPPR